MYVLYTSLDTGIIYMKIFKPMNFPDAFPSQPGHVSDKTIKPVVSLLDTFVLII